MELVISLILTVVVYLIFPFCYRENCGKVPPKKGKKLALWNSIICAGLFCLVRGLISGGETIVTSFAPAVLYYFISKSILTDYNKKDPDPKILTPEEKMISSIKNCQFSIIPIFCFLLLFAIIYPITTTNNYENKLPDYKEATTTKLSSLDANQKVYCEQSGDYYYLYLKKNDDIVIYKFQNRSRYMSSTSKTEQSGRATSSELKNYFDDNIFSGKPSLSFVMPSAIPLGITLVSIFVLVLIIVLIVIHRKAVDIFYKIAKKDKEIIDLKKKYQKDDISKQEYSSEKKRYLSENIIKNNKFFSIFRIIY